MCRDSEGIAGWDNRFCILPGAPLYCIVAHLFLVRLLAQVGSLLTYVLQVGYNINNDFIKTSGGFLSTHSWYSLQLKVFALHSEHRAKWREACIQQGALYIQLRIFRYIGFNLITWEKVFIVDCNRSKRPDIHVNTVSWISIHIIFLVVNYHSFGGFRYSLNQCALFLFAPIVSVFVSLKTDLLAKWKWMEYRLCV